MRTATTRLDAFRQVIERAGLVPPSMIPLGKVTRFPGVGKSNGNTSGWVWLSEDGQGGAFGDWASGLSDTWHAQHDHTMTAAERAAHARRVAELRHIRQEEEANQHMEGAQRAQTIWGQAAPASDDHPYLKRKGVQSHGLRTDPDGRLIIPVTIDGALSSLQFVDASGGKQFLPGGKVKGGTFTIGALSHPDMLLLCEGFATAASLYEATGLPVVVAFSAGNLRPVVEPLRQQFPMATIVVCGDHDLSGTGQRAARDAADAVNGVVALPEDQGQDWNDIHVQRGPDAVRSAIHAAIQREGTTTPAPSTATPAPGEAATEADNESVPVDALGAFPEEAWRGPFKLYRDAMRGTSEAPDTAHFTALWAVAAACLRRRVSFYYAFPHFPNVYLVNFGNTGDSKTSAGRQGLRLLPAEGVKLLRGVGSAEALGDWMQQPEDGPKVSHLLFIEELATLLTRGGWEGSTLLSFLTETFDTPEKYEIPFRKNPVLVQEPTPTLIAGTTIEWLWKGLREIDVHGGFGNRIFYVTGPPKPPIPLPAKPNQEALAEVRRHLQRLATLPPIELFFMHDAQALWRDFYLAWKGTSWPELTTAATKRIPTYIVKLSMVYAALEGTSLITADQVAAAIQVGHYGAHCANLLMNRHRQQGVQSKCEARVLAGLRERPLPAWKIHRAISGSYSAEELARALRALLAAGAIVVTGTTSRHEPIYGRRNHGREV
jgi:phage/plasmid primase-like uncharacterized protein